MLSTPDMNELDPGDTVVMAGSFLYDGSVECDLRIVRSPVCYGSGDYDDPTETRDDQKRETFYVHYGSTTERGTFTSRSHGFRTLEEAIANVEEHHGFGKTIKWRNAKLPTLAEFRAGLPEQAELAGEFIRRLRDCDRY